MCMKIMRSFISYQTNEGLIYLEIIALESWNLLSWWRKHAGRKIVRGVARSRNTGGGLLLQHRPVEGVVVLVVERPEEDPVELAEVHVVRRLLEPQAAAVVEVHGELCGEALAQHLCILYSQKMKADLIVLPIMRRARLYLNRRRHLLLADLLILLLLGGRLQTLPWKRTPIDVHY